MNPKLYCLCALSLASHPVQAEERSTDAYLDKTRGRWEQVSRQIWEYAETALQESRSSELLADLLGKEGFKGQRGVGLPTAFVASAGSGSPVVAILAENDALPEPARKPGETQKSPLAEGAPGHGWGDTLHGAA